MDHPLRIVHAPLHGVSATRRHIVHALSYDPCSLAFSEAYPLNIYPIIIGRPRYPAVVGKKFDPRRLRGAHDTPILRRRHHDKVDSFAYLACGPSTPFKIAPDRWNTGVAYKHNWGTIGHIAAHPNARVQGLDPQQVDRVEKYVKQMAKLEASIRAWQKQGYLIVVTGDLNHGPGGEWWGPQRMFERLDLRTWREGIDWIGYDKRLWLPEKNRILVHDNGQDHPWMIANFRRTEG